MQKIIPWNILDVVNIKTKVLPLIALIVKRICVLLVLINIKNII